MLEYKLPDHFSYSQASLYAQCPREYWFKYIKYPEDRKKYNSSALWFGKSYHSAVELLYNGGTLDSAIVFLEKTAESELNMAKDSNVKQRDGLVQIIQTYYENIFPKYKDMVQNVEEDVGDFYIEGISVPIHAKIDLTLIDGTVIDHKTVAMSRDSERFSRPSAYQNKQMLIYAYYVWQKYGVMPRQVELHRVYKDFNNKYSKRCDVDAWRIKDSDILKAIEWLKWIWRQIEDKNNTFPCAMHNYCVKSPYRNECDMLALREYRTI